MSVISFFCFQELLTDNWAKEFTSENTMPSDADFWNKLQKEWEDMGPTEDHPWLTEFNGGQVKDPVRGSFEIARIL